MRFLLYSIFFVGLFAYPIVIEYNIFWEWISGIFTHSGMHGAGEKNFIDISTIPNNLKYLFGYDKLFFFLMIGSLLLCVLFSFKPFKNPDQPNSKIIHAILAVNITIIVCIAFILKHFVFHYFIPFYIFKCLLIVLITILLIQFKTFLRFKQYKNIVLLLIFLFTLGITYGQALKLRASLSHASERKDSMHKAYNALVPLVEKDKPIIITGPYYGTPFIEFAHNNGFMMTYNRKSLFKPYLIKKYPNAYHYVNWSEKFFHWDDSLTFNNIIDRSDDSFYVYVGKEKADHLPIIEKRIWEVLYKDSVSRKVLYEDKGSGETLIEFIMVTNARIPEDEK